MMASRIGSWFQSSADDRYPQESGRLNEGLQPSHLGAHYNKPGQLTSGVKKHPSGYDPLPEDLFEKRRRLDDIGTYTSTNTRYDQKIPSDFSHNKWVDGSIGDCSRRNEGDPLYCESYRFSRDTIADSKIGTDLHPSQVIPATITSRVTDVRYPNITKGNFSSGNDLEQQGEDYVTTLRRKYIEKVPRKNDFDNKLKDDMLLKREDFDRVLPFRNDINRQPRDDNKLQRFNDIRLPAQLDYAKHPVDYVNSKDYDYLREYSAGIANKSNELKSITYPRKDNQQTDSLDNRFNEGKNIFTRQDACRVSSPPTLEKKVGNANTCGSQPLGTLMDINDQRKTSAKFDRNVGLMKDNYDNHGYPNLDRNKNPKDFVIFQQCVEKVVSNYVISETVQPVEANDKGLLRSKNFASSRDNLDRERYIHARKEDYDGNRDLQIQDNRFRQDIRLKQDNLGPTRENFFQEVGDVDPGQKYVGSNIVSLKTLDYNPKRDDSGLRRRDMFTRRVIGPEKDDFGPALDRDLKRDYSGPRRDDIDPRKNNIDPRDNAGPRTHGFDHKRDDGSRSCIIDQARFIGPNIDSGKDEICTKSNDYDPIKDNNGPRAHDKNLRKADFESRMYNYEPRRDDNVSRREDFAPRRVDIDTEKGNVGWTRDNHIMSLEDFDSRRNDFHPRADDFDPRRDDYQARMEDYYMERDKFRWRRDDYSPRRHGFDSRTDDNGRRIDNFADSNFDPRRFQVEDHNRSFELDDYNTKSLAENYSLTLAERNYYDQLKEYELYMSMNRGTDDWRRNYPISDDHRHLVSDYYGRNISDNNEFCLGRSALDIEWERQMSYGNCMGDSVLPNRSNDKFGKDNVGKHLSLKQRKDRFHYYASSDRKRNINSLPKSREVKLNQNNPKGKNGSKLLGKSDSSSGDNATKPQPNSDLVEKLQPACDAKENEKNSNSINSSKENQNQNCAQLSLDGEVVTLEQIKSIKGPCGDSVVIFFQLDEHPIRTIERMKMVKKQRRVDLTFDEDSKNWVAKVMINENNIATFSALTRKKASAEACTLAVKTLRQHYYSVLKKHDYYAAAQSVDAHGRLIATIKRVPDIGLDRTKYKYARKKKPEVEKILSAIDDYAKSDDVCDLILAFSADQKFVRGCRKYSSKTHRLITRQFGARGRRYIVISKRIDAWIIVEGLLHKDVRFLNNYQLLPPDNKN